MRHDVQVRLVREVLRMIDAKTSPMAEAPFFNPSGAYLDPARYAREQARLFSALPLLAGFTGDAPRPGDWFTSECAGTPLLFVRAEDGRLRAFLNICRHRGSRLADGRGHTPKLIACSFHAWSYDLHGRLHRRPMDLDGFAGIDCVRLGLIPVPCAERDGMIFARTRGETPIDPAAHLGGLAQDLADYGFADYTYFKQIQRVLPANWKLLMDTFMEGYHIFALHRESLHPAFLSYPGFFEWFGPHSRFGAVRRSIEELRGRPEREWSLRAHASIIYVIAPHTVLNLPMDGHLELWEMHPQSADETLVRMRFYAPEPVVHEKALDKWERSFAISASVVFDEDFVQQAGIHRNLATGRIPGVFFGRNEPALIRFHEQLNELLGLPQPALPPDHAAATARAE